MMVADNKVDASLPGICDLIVCLDAAVENDDEFHTSRLVSDLLSPTISNMRPSDPTFSAYAPGTTEWGDFSCILSLATLQPHSIPGNELPFVAEAASLLQNAQVQRKACLREM